MNKKIFICGQVYDLSVITDLELRNDIQGRINEYYKCHSDRFLVDVKIEEGQVEIVLYRRYKEDIDSILPYDTYFNDEHNIFCIDSDLLLGRDFKDSLLVKDPGGVGFGYYYSWPVSEFIQLYKDNCKSLKASIPKKIEFEGDKRHIKLSIGY